MVCVIRSFSVVNIVKSRSINFRMNHLINDFSAVAKKDKIAIDLKRISLNRLISTNLDLKSNFLLQVSGGSDSIAMLHIFANIKKENPILNDLNLFAVHFNHKIRQESDEEEEFVQKLTKNYGIKCVTFSLPEKDRKSSNFQEVARDWRRSESLKLVDSIKKNSNLPTYILTAHHREDNVETILLKLLRGTHITGFNGINEFDGIFYRPFLDISKEELKKYLEAENLEWREDLSNQKRDYKRNKVRLDLIPILYDIAGGKEPLEKRLLSLSNQSCDVRQLINLEVEQINALMTYDRFPGSPLKTIFFSDLMKGLPDILKGQLIYNWVYESVGVKLASFQIEDILRLFSLENNRVKHTIPNNWDIVRTGDELRLQYLLQKTNFIKSQLCLSSGHNVIIYHPSFLVISQDLTPQKNRYFFSLKFSPSELEKSSQKSSSFKLRLVQDGDKIQIKNGPKERVRKVSEFLKDNFRLPIHQRSKSIVCLTCSEDGNVENKLIGLNIPECNSGIAYISPSYGSMEVPSINYPTSLTPPAANPFLLQFSVDILFSDFDSNQINDNSIEKDKTNI